MGHIEDVIVNDDSCASKKQGKGTRNKLRLVLMIEVNLI